MATLTSSLIVKLIDGISAPAKAAAKSLEGIGQAARRLNSSGFANRLGQAAEANARKMDMLRGKMLEAAAAGYVVARALSAPLDQAREFEGVLLDIGQKADLSDDGIKRLGGSIATLAADLKKTLSQNELAKGVDFLAGMGLDPDNAMTLMRPIGKAATAYKANVDDLARAGYAALDNLKVPADQFGKALDVMAQSGKEGAFELRDMAQYMPSLGAAFQGLGQKGVKSVGDLAAALQIVRKGTGDSASAAINLENLLQKIVAPDSVKKFSKFGIDIRKELVKAQKAGVSPIEMIAELTNKALKGNLANLGDLFQDAQVQKALRPLIQNIEEYRQIRARALSAEGVVDTDFQRRLLTGDAYWSQFKNQMLDLSRTIGTILLPTVNNLLGVFGEWAQTVAGLAERFPGLTRAVITITTALVAFRVAAIAAAFASTFLRGAVLSAGLATLAFGRGIGTIGALAMAPFAAAATRLVGTLQIVALRFRLAAAAGMAFNGAFVAGTLATFGRALLGLLNPMGLVRAAFVALRFAVISTGIGAIAVGLAMAGAWIYNNWSNIGVAFEAFKGAFDRAIAPIKPALDPVIGAFGAIYDKVASLVGPLDGDVWARWGLAAGKAVGETVVWFVELPGKISAAIVSLAASLYQSAAEWGTSLLNGARSTGEGVVQWAGTLPGLVVDAVSSLGGALFGTGVQAIQGLWDGMKSLVDQMIAWVASIPSRVVGSLSSLPGKVKGLFGFGGDGAAPGGGGQSLPARARGGYTPAGQDTLVGEEGPEIFRPGRSGTVIPTGQTRKAFSGSAGGGASITNHYSFQISGAGDARAVADEVVRRIEERDRRARREAFADVGLRTA